MKCALWWKANHSLTFSISMHNLLFELQLTNLQNGHDQMSPSQDCCQYFKIRMWKLGMCNPALSVFYDWVALHCVCTHAHTSLSIDPWTDTSIISLSWVLYIMLQWTKGIYIDLYELVFSFSLDKYQKWNSWITW